MTNFWSCRLINIRKLPDVRDFIDADLFCWGGASTLFFKWTPSTNANISSCYYAYFGKRSNIFTACSKFDKAEYCV